jgi:hypothetical protein
LLSAAAGEADKGQAEGGEGEGRGFGHCVVLKCPNQDSI